MSDNSIPPSKEELLQLFGELPYETLVNMYQRMQQASSSDVTSLDDQIKEVDKGSENVETVKDTSKHLFLREVEESRICPKCHNTAIYKHGVRNGKQRYKCKSCGKVFTPTTGTAMSGSHQNTETWKIAIEDTLDQISIADTADKLELSMDTVWNMRHKILIALSRLEQKKPPILSEVSELDETYVLESYKGSDIPDEKRLPRKRGGKAEKRGLSNEQVCIFTGIQRGGPLYMKCVNMGKPSNADIREVFEGHLGDDSMYMTDGLKGYQSLEKMADCKVVNGKREESSSFYNINTVNNVHSQFKKRYEFYGGVATKYINRYLALMDKTYKSKKEMAEAVFKEICIMQDTDLFISQESLLKEELSAPRT